MFFVCASVQCQLTSAGPTSPVLLGTKDKQSSLKQLCTELRVTPEQETGKGLSFLLTGTTEGAAQGLSSIIPVMRCLCITEQQDPVTPARVKDVVVHDHHAHQWSINSCLASGVCDSLAGPKVGETGITDQSSCCLGEIWT